MYERRKDNEGRKESKDNEGRTMELGRKDIECYFGWLKQWFKILRIPNLMREKKNNDMMFTIVAIQNMLLDYSTAAQRHTSRKVKLDR